MLTDRKNNYRLDFGHGHLRKFDSKEFSRRKKENNDQQKYELMGK